MKQYITFQFKKILALALIIPLALSLLVGCSGNEGTAGTISDFESRTHIGVSTPDESEDTSREPLTGDFVVSEKKYDYKDANIMLLYVENQTNRHYNVTIKGKYLDENGETIQEETQTFEGFASGWANHFVFYPRKAFASFTYSVDTVEYVPEEHTCDESGTPYSSFIEFVYDKNLRWDSLYSEEIDPDARHKMRYLGLQGKAISSHETKEIGAEFQVLILDTDGEIYFASHDYRDELDTFIGLPPSGWRYHADHIGAEPGWSVISLKKQEIGEDETIPENVQGVFTAIYAVLSVYDQDIYLSEVIPDDISIEYIYG